MRHFGGISTPFAGGVLFWGGKSEKLVPPPGISADVAAPGLPSPIAVLLLRFSPEHCYAPSLVSAWIPCEQMPVAVTICRAMICFQESSNKLQL